MNIIWTNQELEHLNSFRQDCCEHSAEIDPSDEQDWFSLSIGYFIAKGMPIMRAYELALHARYDHEYWEE